MRERKLALLALNASTGGQSAQEAINRGEKDLDPDQKPAFVRELVYGVLENRMWIDHILSKASKTPIRKMDPAILNILRMGIYELLFIETPAHAAVNEAVKLSKGYAYRGIDRFVNGVLRGVDRKRATIMDIQVKDPVERLAIETSHPRWILELLMATYGREGAEAYARADNTPAPVTLRIRQGQDREVLKKDLEAQGVLVVDHPLRQGSLILESGRITDSQAFKDGRVTIQDAGSQLAADAVGAGPGERVLDLCAAPGGKAVQLAETGAEVVANDISSKRMERVLENAKRMGVALATATQDATVFVPEWASAFDRILVDAPCSGLGLLRRKPEIRWNRKPEDLKSLADLQAQILDKAYAYLKPGGRLVYSTCTVAPIENEDQVQAFLQRHPDMTLTPYSETADFLNLAPHLNNSDGFFIAQFTKSKPL